MCELRDGSLFLAWMQTNRSELEANDEASAHSSPSSLRYRRFSSFQ